MKQNTHYITLLRKMKALDDRGMVLAIGHLKANQTLKELWADAVRDLRTPKLATIPGQQNCGEPFSEQYVYKKLIGIGGIGEVFAAVDIEQFVQSESVTNTVAVKRLLAESLKSKTCVGRFRREIATSLLLEEARSPYIVDMLDFDFGLDVSEPFAVFEHCADSNPISEHKVPTSLEDAIFVTLCVGSALFTLHELAFLHRDVKPQNVLWDGQGKVKLIDFGIVSIPEDLFFSEPRLVDVFSKTPLNETAGTPMYMPPEQFVGQSCQATDVFALCSLLVFMLTGRVRIPRGLALPWSTEFQALLHDGTVDDYRKRIPSVQDFLTRLVATKEGGRVDNSQIHMPSVLRGAIDLAGFPWS